METTDNLQVNNSNRVYSLRKARLEVDTVLRTLKSKKVI